MDVSFKAVVIDDQKRVLLGSNPRGEWELLGGRADLEDDSPEATVEREVREESALRVDVGAVIDSWFYDVPGGGRVAILSFLARPESSAIVNSDEHHQVCFFTVDECMELVMPDGYKRSIRRAIELIDSTSGPELETPRR